VIPVVETNPVRAPTLAEFPTSGTIDLPRWDYKGIITAPYVTPGFGVDGTLPLHEAFVIMELNQAVIVFDILVNNIVIDTVTTDETYKQRYDIDVPVVLNDSVKIDITDVGAGTAEDVSVVLRPFITSEVVPDFATDGLIHLIDIGDLEISAGAGGASTVTAPAGRQVGNLLVLQRHTPTPAATFTLPTGWNRISQASGAVNSELMESFWRIADGTSADDAVIASDGSTVNLGQITAWSNVDPDNPVIGFPPTVYTSDTDPWVAPSITNALRQNVVLRFYGGDGTPSHVLDSGGFLYDANGGGTMAAGYDRPGLGASGVGEDNLSTAETGAAMSITLRPNLPGPTIRVGTGTSSGTSSTITPDYPADCAAGDIAFLAITTAETGTQADPTVPAGWTRIQFQTYNYTLSGVHRSTALYQKDAALTGSEDGTTISVTGPSDHRHSAVIFTVRGAASISTAAGGVNPSDNTNVSYSGPTRAVQTNAVMAIVVGAQLSTVGSVNVSDDSVNANLVLAQNAASSGLFSQTSVQAFPLDSTNPGTIVYTIGAGCTDVRSIAVICSP
jgi:hypothetical protein